jgi:hypothetical protein
MTQRILSLLLLGAILIGTVTAVTHNLCSSAEHILATETSISGAKNKQIRGLKDAIADYERTKHDPKPIAVRIVK